MLFEPVQHGGQKNEAQEIKIVLFVMGGDTPVAFDSLKEVFDLMQPPVIPAMPPHRSAPGLARRNTTATASFRERGAKNVAVVAPVGHNGLPHKLRDHPVWVTARISACWPGGKPTSTARPVASAQAVSLVLSPPLARPRA